MAASDKPAHLFCEVGACHSASASGKGRTRLVASDPIAVIAWDAAFLAEEITPEELWTALREGRDGITAIPAGRWKDAATLPLQLRRGGYIEEIDGFDAAFFGISPREAQQMDPQQRLLLEV